VKELKGYSCGGLTKLCMVRGTSSSTSTSSSSPTSGVMSVFHSVSLLRLQENTQHKQDVRHGTDYLLDTLILLQAAS